MLPIPNLAQSHHSLVDLNVRLFCGKFSSLAREEWRLDTETKYISEDISFCLLHNSKNNNNDDLLMFSHYTRKLLWDHYGTGKASFLGCNFHNMHIFKKQMLTPTELMLPPRNGQKMLPETYLAPQATVYRPLGSGCIFITRGHIRHVPPGLQIGFCFCLFACLFAVKE